MLEFLRAGFESDDTYNLDLPHRDELEPDERGWISLNDPSVKGCRAWGCDAVYEDGDGPTGTCDEEFVAPLRLILDAADDSHIPPETAVRAALTRPAPAPGGSR